MSLFAPNRDVGVVELGGGLYLVLACDSLGGIGEKERDVVRVSPYVVGRFTGRVALMEVLATGAAPRAVSAAIAGEPAPTGEGILAGLRDELKATGLALPLVVSTEKNVPTCQTGLGVTAVGTALRADLRLNTTQPGDRLYCVGVPKVGAEVTLEDPLLADCALVQELLACPGVHDVIPVGSRGLKGEAEQLAGALGLTLHWEEDLPVDITKSAGPATCLLVSASQIPRLGCQQPLQAVATLASFLP